MKKQAVVAFLKVTDHYKGFSKHLALFSWQEVEGSAIFLYQYFILLCKIKLNSIIPPISTAVINRF